MGILLNRTLFQLKLALEIGRNHSEQKHLQIVMSLEKFEVPFVDSLDGA